MVVPNWCYYRDNHTLNVRYGERILIRGTSLLSMVYRSILLVRNGSRFGVCRNIRRRNICHLFGSL